MWPQCALERTPATWMGGKCVSAGRTSAVGSVPASSGRGLWRGARACSQRAGGRRAGLRAHPTRHRLFCAAPQSELASLTNGTTHELKSRKRNSSLASLTNGTTHELKSRKRYWSSQQPCLQVTFEHRYLYNLVALRRNTQSKLPVNQRVVLT